MVKRATSQSNHFAAVSQNRLHVFGARLTYLNSLNSNSDQHQFSLNDINALFREKVRELIK